MISLLDIFTLGDSRRLQALPLVDRWVIICACGYGLSLDGGDGLLQMARSLALCVAIALLGCVLSIAAGQGRDRPSGDRS